MFPANTLRLHSLIIEGPLRRMLGAKNTDIFCVMHTTSLDVGTEHSLNIIRC